jgi:hypothetical protein
MPKHLPPRLPEHPAEKRVRELENQLYDVRRTVLRLVGQEASKILTAPHELKSQHEAYTWFEEATQKILELAEPLSNEVATPDFYHQSERAVCPLCGDSAIDYYSPDGGFAFPEGLLRHLRGERRARQCDVAKTALDLAIYWATLDDRIRG